MSSRKKLYSVHEILLLTLCSVLCGADGWQDIEDYGKAKIEFLCQYFDYENGILSDDTIRRIYRSINPSEFEKFFRDWVQGIAATTQTKDVSIDAPAQDKQTEVSAKEDSVIAIAGARLISSASNK